MQQNTNMPAISGLSDASQARVVLYQSGRLVHAPLESAVVANSSAISDALGLGTASQQDYEEGTWTPALAFGGASTGIAYNTREGSYIKMGKLVVASFHFRLSSKGTATGNATVSGLPFAAGTSGSFWTGSISWHAPSPALLCLINASATSIRLVASPSGDADDTDFADNSRTIGNIIYETA